MLEWACMPSRFEIMVDSGREDEFRKMVSSFEGAKISSDPSRTRALREEKDKRLPGLIAPMLDPVESEIEEGVREAVENLFHDIFDHHVQYEIKSLHLASNEELVRARSMLHGLYSINSQHSRQLAVLMERYGLTTGQAKPRRAVAEALGYSESYVSNVEDMGIGFMKSYVFKNELDPAVIELKERNPLPWWIEERKIQQLELNTHN